MRQPRIDKMNKKEMITAIIQTLSSSGTYISGEIFFGLAFRTESELRQMCKEMYIKY